MDAPKIIITTEKDSVRLECATGLSDDAKKNLFALPIKVKFVADGAERFDEKILNYVRENSRDSILADKQTERKTASKNTIVFSHNDLRT